MLGSPLTQACPHHHPLTIFDLCCSVLQVARQTRNKALKIDLAWQLIAGVLPQLRVLHAMVSHLLPACNAVHLQEYGTLA